MNHSGLEDIGHPDLDEIMAILSRLCPSVPHDVILRMVEEALRLQPPLSPAVSGDDDA